MPVVTRASVVGKNKKTNVKRVDTPAWGKGTFAYVRTLRASEVDDVQRIAELTNGKMGTASAMVEWCILGACDAKGKRIFKDDDKDGLMNGPLVPIQDIVTAFMKFNGITEDDAAKN